MCMLETAGRPSGSLARGAPLSDEDERHPPSIAIEEFPAVELVWDPEMKAHVARARDER